MEEVLIRDELLVNVLDQGLPEVPAMALQPEVKVTAPVEFAYLQLRMICELIALACLTAHGDIPAASSQRLKRAYAADDIVKALGNLHPEFYPKPTKQAQAKDAAGIWHSTDITTGYLTKADLIALYGECGGALHRGSLKSLKANRTPTASSEKAIHWANKIWNLLEHHEIQTIDPNIKLIGLMKDKEAARPQFSYLTKRPDGLWMVDGTVRAIH